MELNKKRIREDVVLVDHRELLGDWIEMMWMERMEMNDKLLLNRNVRMKEDFHDSFHPWSLDSLDQTLDIRNWVINLTVWAFFFLVKRPFELTRI